MKSNNVKYLLGIFIFSLILSSCSINSHTMKTPNHHVEFYKQDFEYSKQLSASATSTRVFLIDWQRLFKWENGEIDYDGNPTATQTINVNSTITTDAFIGAFSTLVPIIGEYQKGRINSYALYELMTNNPGYDIVFYPQFKTKRFVIPFIYSKRTSEVTARLAKIKQE